MINELKVKKDQSIDNLRALAIILVVFGHSIILYSSSWNLYSTINKCEFLDLLKAIINLIQMPLFFSISGYLYFYTHSHTNLLKLIKKKFVSLAHNSFFIIYFLKFNSQYHMIIYLKCTIQ